jgi:hypothetical protein
MTAKQPTNRTRRYLIASALAVAAFLAWYVPHMIDLPV